MEDYEALKFWLDVAQTIGLIAVFVWGIITRRALANTGLIEKNAHRLTAVETDVALLRQRGEHAPSHGDLQRIHDRISENGKAHNEMNAQLAGLEATLKAISADVHRINNHQLGKINE